MRLQTFNIRFENPHDGENDWPHRKDFLSELIHNFGPNILGTQEGRRPQIESLNELLKDYDLIDQHRQWITERMYPCLFLHRESISLLDSGDFWLSETPDIAGSKLECSAFPRLCTWAKVLNLKEKKNFLIANMHLDHVKSQTRHKQIKIFIKEIKKVNKENYPLIIMGDFNESPFENVRQELARGLGHLYDPWFDSFKKEEPTHHSFKGHRKDGTRIDWILIDRQLKYRSIDLEKRSLEGRYPSDHFGVKLTLS